ncbi:MAG TPA: excinuclease ABC subunit UvrC [Thermoanaerobacterales bacterium]|nr:excinuclease ABC subunit UvrC [Thermoanaerobacterales bacterium]
MNIEATLQSMPSKPGAYIFKDNNGRVIYVGKAKCLKNRVRSYFSSSDNSAKTRAIRNNLNEIEFIVTDTEIEALILECNLIKKYRPKYNILLKDDKNYPYIKITTEERFPRIVIVRKVKNDKSKYFGPYTDMGAVKETIKLIKKIFPIRSCSKNLENIPLQERECLNFHINRCLAPCQNYIDDETYNGYVKDIIMFLNGKYDSLVKKLVNKMKKAARAHEYEKAAGIRNQIEAVKKIMEQQKIVSTDTIDQDVIGYAAKDKRVCITIFFVRNGKLIGKETFFLTGIELPGDDDIIESFIKQFYTDTVFVPKVINVQEEIEDVETIEEWLSEKKGAKVNIRTPKRGEKRKLLEMVIQNAKISLEQEIYSLDLEKEKADNALKELASYIDLDNSPARIEAFDISNIQGSDSTASMVVFEDGFPQNSEYRRFKIRTVSGADDFASMREVIYRRFRRGLEESSALKEMESSEIRDVKFSKFPDLIIIDGGKGQLNAAIESLRKLGLDTIPVISIAEKQEHVFLPNKSDPLILPSNSLALHLLQRIRDEAHRFAISYHRDLRRKKNFKSILDDIPGIGKVRKKALLKAFGSVKGIREASLDEIKKVKGMNEKAAEAVYEFFHT